MTKSHKHASAPIPGSRAEEDCIAYLKACAEYKEIEKSLERAQLLETHTLDTKISSEEIRNKVVSFSEKRLGLLVGAKSNKHLESLYKTSRATAEEDVVNAARAYEEAQAQVAAIHEQLNYEKGALEGKILAIARISAQWRRNALVTILDDCKSAQIAYGNFRGDSKNPHESDFDGLVVLRRNGAIERHRAPDES